MIAEHPARGASALTLFAAPWAAALLFHVGAGNLWRAAWLDAGVALLLLLRPASTLALVAFALVQVVATVPLTPNTGNHALLMALVNVGLLVTASTLAVQRRTLRIDRDALSAAFAPAARVSLLAFYFFTVFHKLNTDWFDPASSCGPAFSAAMHRRFPFLPDLPLLHTAAIYHTLVVEAAIPLLLVFRRSRRLGVLVGVLFHGVIALNPISGFYNFSAVVVALLSLFVDPSLVRDAARWLGARRLTMAAWTAALGFIVVAVNAVWRPDVGVTPTSGALALWVVYWMAVLALFVGAWQRRPPPATTSAPFALPLGVAAVMPLLVIVNGAMPYLGLKTESAWAMYSNLTTEGGRSNHWIVPARWQPFGYQRDLVQITSASHPVLHTVARRAQSIPYFELRRRPDAAVTYVRDGVEHRVDRIADDPAFTGPVPRWLGAVLLFRPVTPDGTQSCRH